MSVVEKLMRIQTKIKAPKSQYNKFGKYFYRNCEDILCAIKPLLQEEKCIIVISDDLVLIGNRYYIKAEAKIVDCETGEKISTNAYAREDEDKKGMDASQVTGSTSSYARKYALNGLLCIDDSKDADSNENEESKKQDLLKEFEKEIKRTGKSCKYFLKEAAADTVEDLSEDFLNNALCMLRKCPDKKSGGN